jgi:hypothetical protein
MPTSASAGLLSERLDELRDLIPLNRVPRMIPVELRDGHPIHVATIYRWSARNLLKTVRIGSRIFTRPEWVAECLDAFNQRIEEPPARRVTPAPSPPPATHNDREVDRRLDRLMGPKKGHPRPATV